MPTDAGGAREHSDLGDRGPRARYPAPRKGCAAACGAAVLTPDNPLQPSLRGPGGGTIAAVLPGMSIIVCATDFSPESKAVVSKAGERSRLLGLPLELFHVFDVPFSPDVLDEISDNLRTSAEATIATQAEPLRAMGIDVRTFVQLGVKDDIVRHARAVGASLLVLGTHSRKGAARFFLAFAEHAIRTAPCPVLVIPPATQERPVTARRAPLSSSWWASTFRRPATPRSPGCGGSANASCNVRLLHLYSPAREHPRLGFDPRCPSR